MIKISTEFQFNSEHELQLKKCFARILLNTATFQRLIIQYTPTFAGRKE